jgi:hypothetical protein
MENVLYIHFPQVLRFSRLLNEEERISYNCYCVFQYPKLFNCLKQSEYHMHHLL